MRVLMLRPRVELGGVTTHLKLLSKELLSQGHVIGIATTGGGLVSELHHLGVGPFYGPLYPSTPVNLIRSILFVTHIVRRQQIEVLHSHHRFTTIVGHMVSRLTHIPLIVTLHEFKTNWRILAPSWSGDITIVPSHALKHHLQTFYEMPESRIVVIPHAIEMFPPAAAEQRLALRQTLAPDPDTQLVGYIGRLSEEKGCHYFVESIPLITRNEPNVRCIIVGDGPEETALRSLACKRGLDPNQILLGPRDDIPALMEVLDVVVIPSLAESFALVALEAMRAARPVVATTVGGLPEVVRHQETGLLVPPKSPAALAEAICHLLNNPDHSLQLGRRGQQLVVESYTPAVMAERTLQAYTSAR